MGVQSLEEKSHKKVAFSILIQIVKHQVNGLYDSSTKHFFLENDLQLGKQEMFHVIKKSKEMKNTITKCEAPSIKGEDKSCVSSLGSMIDFSTSRLGKNVDVKWKNKPNLKLITLWLEENFSDKVAPSPKMYIHMQYSIVTPYKVYLVGEDGTK
ncbi:hypothetical protein Leryth_027520 [Lithospermum erythrorhizon]|nr:hypothetical protein Leryth_027520 [Lithospermum erythrorhizon]